MHGAGWIEMAAIRNSGYDDTPALRLAHIVAERFRHRIQRQPASSEAVHELQAVHFFLPFGTHGSVSFAGNARRHRLNPRFKCAANNDTRVARDTRFLERLKLI